MSRRPFSWAVGAGIGATVVLCCGRFIICGLNGVCGVLDNSVVFGDNPLRLPIVMSDGLRGTDCSRFNICCGTKVAGDGPRELLLTGWVCFFIVSKSGALTGPRMVAEVMPGGFD